MSRLTFSPHVVDIYSFCGRTVFTEFAGGPSLGSIFDKAKSHRFRRIEIARDLAIGLSHVHFGKNSYEDDIQITHFDINPANIVVTDDKRLRINDFNIAQFVKRNMTSDEQCNMPSHQYPNAQWRSPEEVDEAKTLTAKADVFSLGHIFYRLICGHEPWNKLEAGGKPTSAELSLKVKNGILPRIPGHILNSNDPEVVAIREAMFMCYTFEPSQRPASKVIAKFLEDELNKMQK
jgi:serine/threonine protein kinase